MNGAAQLVVLRVAQGTSCPCSQVKRAALAALLVPASLRAVKSCDSLNEGEECKNKIESDFKPLWKSLQTFSSPEGVTLTPALKSIQNDFSPRADVSLVQGVEDREV